MSLRAKRVRLLAFYLPQFHPIPENDAWWGKGFTEWRSVSAAKPLFAGHYQPHLPADLGFYDLRVPEVRQAQADLAREYGIYGFCYYHYWFNGKRLLGRPLDEMLASGEPDFPFCLCWANESWTRAWDGLEHHILLEQKYDLEDDRRHIRWLMTAFRHQNYIRVDGKPLFLVYRVSKIPDPLRTTSLWREEAHKMGVGDIYLATVESLPDDRVDPTRNGFDAAVEFQPDWLNLREPLSEIGEVENIHDYGAVVKRMLGKPRPSYRRFPCVTSGWDNTPRRDSDACILKGATPPLYQEWLEAVTEKFSPPSPEENFIFINAWNEWGEGAHLEPCQKWGRAYLEATRRAVRKTESDMPQFARHSHQLRTKNLDRSRITVCIPIHSAAEHLDEAINSILTQTFKDLELLIVDSSSTGTVATLIRSLDDNRVKFFEHSPRLSLVDSWNKCVALSSGDYLCIFHPDDIMMPTNLEEKIRILENHANVGLVHSNVLPTDGNGNLVSKEAYSKKSIVRNGIHKGSEYFRDLLFGENVVSSTALVRRECYEKRGGFDTRLPATADCEMWMRTALFYDVAHLTDPLVKVRRRDRDDERSLSSPKALEQLHHAKKLVLEEYADRIPRVEQLRSRVAQEDTSHALDQAFHHCRQKQYDEAKRYLQVAAEARGSTVEDGSCKEYIDWFLDAVNEMWQQDPQGTRSDRSKELGAASFEQAPTHDPVRREILSGLSGEDIGRDVPPKKLVKAIGFKIAARPGFRWLYRFRGLGKSLLGG